MFAVVGAFGGLRIYGQSAPFDNDVIEKRDPL